ncbi:MAG: cell division suppressor protein YneA [Anaerovoracaceae bacterium]|jgi:nucleoid-associated protein YgaU
MIRKYRIKSHLRFSIFLSLMIILTVFLFSSFFNMNQVDSLSNQEYTSVLIKNGDTLWGLAKIYGPNNLDTREVIYTICDINNISPNEIQPGQSILIPKYL